MTSPVGAGGRLRLCGVLGAAVLLPGCAWLGGRTAEASGDPAPWEAVQEHLARDRHVEADAALRRVAARCENGEEGRHALLLLTTLWLDPANPAAEADSAAVFAARVLALPDSPPEERYVAEGLYLLALEMGADPYLRPASTQTPGAPALRFSDCDVPAPRTPVALPVLGREPLAAVVLRLTGEREAETARASELETKAGSLEARIHQLQTELDAARAEIDRIRRVLAGPDTTRAGPP